MALESTLCAFLSKIVSIKHCSPMGSALRQRSGKSMLHLFFSIHGALGSRLAHWYRICCVWSSMASMSDGCKERGYILHGIRAGGL